MCRSSQTAQRLWSQKRGSASDSRNKWIFKFCVKSERGAGEINPVKQLSGQTSRISEVRERESGRAVSMDGHGGKDAELKLFVEQCKSNPSILHNPSLAFFKTYLQSLGARIPPETPKSDKGDEDILDSQEYLDAKKPDLSTDDKSDDIVESDVELDDTDVVLPDYDPPQKMGDTSIEVTEENMDAAQISKSKAVNSISEGKLHEAIDHLTEAIMLNPSSAILYATRGDSYIFVIILLICLGCPYIPPSPWKLTLLISANVYVKLTKPNAAIRDADAALQINPDSAKGYKIRGMARAMLGQWEAAARDLHVASKLDYDEEIGQVEPNAHKIDEHRRKYERLRKERELRKIEREWQRRRAEAQAKYESEKKMGQPSESKASEPEAASSLNDGQVIGICSAVELEKKLNAASSSSCLAVLYFTATWCGPCRFIAPLFTSLAGKYPKVVFLKVDIDEARDAAARWNISSVPTFFFIKNGKEIDKVVGADKSSLEKKIAQHAG
ncbi:TPR repeat-containing thioredoxin TDX like [Actinidia chinensis var. chinensis]|uniref:TPR repeat-containing thioredoxin TDX like n=1 Tax=Actinidia chinensis var. chinensis TaxID=1590841 RepID=A0A2R6QHH9_ACTCC|nr:TPR repeat-containing thioredoxin TDX like [Actinidia chinensis var. chinensis]